MLNLIASISSLNTNRSHYDGLVESVLSDICSIFHADYGFISFEITSHYLKSSLITKVYGLTLETAQILNDYTNTAKLINTKLFDTDFQYVYDLKTGGDSELPPVANQLSIKKIVSVPISGMDKSIGVINLYYTSTVNIDNEILGSIHAIGNLLVNVFRTREAYQSYQEEENLRKDYFFKLPNYHFIIDTSYSILEFNENVLKLIGDKILYRPYKFTDFIESTDEIRTFGKICDYLELNESSDELIFNLKLPNYALDVEEGEIVKPFQIIFKKVRTVKTDLGFLISAKELVKWKSTISDDEAYNKSIIAKLSQFKGIYDISPKEAVKYAKNIFYPAAFAFALNEMTGPIPIAASPPINLSSVMGEGINLLASLNSEQIQVQSYITGMFPWQEPEGEINWIAFIQKNEKARAKSEIHVIGVVTRKNLLTAQPRLMQAMYGNLMGAMNTHIRILTDDKADFVTKAYQNDRNFSTVALLERHLENIRTVCAELLGPYAFGDMPFA